MKIEFKGSPASGEDHTEVSAIERKVQKINEKNEKKFNKSLKKSQRAFEKKEKFQSKYAKAEAYLKEKKETNKKKEVINLARREKRNSSFAGRLVKGVGNVTAPKTGRSRPIAKTNRGVLFSSGGVGASVNKNVLFSGSTNSLLSGKKKSKKRRY